MPDRRKGVTTQPGKADGRTGVLWFSLAAGGGLQLLWGVVADIVDSRM